MVCVQHKSQRQSPYQIRKPPDLIPGKRPRHLPRVAAYSKLHTTDESPILTLPARRRTLSEPSVMSASSAGKYKCVHVRSAGTVMHPDTNTPVKTEPPPGLSVHVLKSALTKDPIHTCKDPSTCSCQVVLTGENNLELHLLLDALNNWCSIHLGSPSPCWNALLVTNAANNGRSFDVPESSPFYLLQIGGSDTLQIFPNTKSPKAHNLLLEVPMGPFSAVLVNSLITAGSSISSAKTPGYDENVNTLHAIPIRTSTIVSVPTPSHGAQTGRHGVSDRDEGLGIPSEAQGKSCQGNVVKA